ncbi:MAG: metallophosphoesterase family protein [Endozoicomonas sp.]|uniref:metallophosphoesterase family protein n=1 Tax=Endozoicomonas sp. TaxID=1892382 RepID=UPI003D9B7DFD
MTTDPQFDNRMFSRNQTSLSTLSRINNAIQKQKAHGVVIAGDLTQNARLYDEFVYYEDAIKPFKHRVYDGMGNHDDTPADFWQTVACYFKTHECVARDKIINHLRSRPRQEPVCLNDEGSVYAWKWEDIYFIQLGVFPGDKPDKQGWDPSVRPEKSLDFLKQQLSALPDKSTPVFLFMHFDVDADIGSGGAWSYDQLDEFWEALDGYNIAMIFSGHIHATCDYGLLKHFPRPKKLSKGPASLPVMLGGAALNGVYTQVGIDQNVVTLQRFCGDSETPANTRSFPIERSGKKIMTDSYWKECPEKPERSDFYPWGEVGGGVAIAINLIIWAVVIYKIKKRC